MHEQQPACWHPQYSFFDLMVPLHPIQIINRVHYVDIPVHIYQPYFINEVVDPGYPTN